MKTIHTESHPHYYSNLSGNLGVHCTSCSQLDVASTRPSEYNYQWLTLGTPDDSNDVDIIEKFYYDTS